MGNVGITSPVTIAAGQLESGVIDLDSTYEEVQVAIPIVTTTDIYLKGAFTRDGTYARIGATRPLRATTGGFIAILPAGGFQYLTICLTVVQGLNRAFTVRGTWHASPTERTNGWDWPAGDSGKVYVNQNVAVSDAARRFETATKRLHDVVLKVSLNAQTFGGASGQSFTLSPGEAWGVTHLDLSSLYFKNSVAGAHGRVDVLGVEV